MTASSAIPRSPGVYLIINTVNGKFYIGSTIDLKGRIIAHKTHLRKRKHGNSYLQKAYLKYGDESFLFLPVAFCEIEDAKRLEQLFLDANYGTQSCYNLAPFVGYATKGVKMSDEHKRKIGAANSAALSGRTLSPETRLKLSASIKKFYAEHPRIVSESTRLKLSLVKRGRKMPFNNYPRSDEMKRKISETKLDFRLSDSDWKTYSSLKEQPKKLFLKMNGYR